MMKRVEVVRYIAVGSAAFVIEYLVFIWILAVQHQWLVAAQVISYSCGLIVSFLGSRYFTFKKADYHHSIRRQFLSYTVLAAVNALTTSLVIEQLVNTFHWPVYIAKIGVMGMVIIWNYLLMKKVIFVSRSE